MTAQQEDGPRETASGLQRPGGKAGQPSSGEKAKRESADANEEQLVQTDRQPDDMSTRAHSSRHGKVTAENWNQ